MKLLRIFSSAGKPTSLTFILAVFFLVVSNPSEAQQSTRVVKIGELLFRDPSGLGPGRQAFRRQLHDLGYVDGKNLAYETRSATGSIGRFQELARELVNLKVDLLLASSKPEALAFKSATTTIPIVFVITSDPVTDGLVQTLAKPGGNLTGVTTIATALAGKSLEILKQTIPRLSRVAVMWNRSPQSSAPQLEEIEAAAAQLGMQVYSMNVSAVEEFEDAFRAAVKARSTALFVTGNSVNTANRQLIADLAAKHRLSAIFDREDFVASGGLMSYGPDRAESYRRAAIYVDKIIRGARPAGLPVEQPTKFELVVNLKTAKQIGVTIPPNVLARADRVIR
jgi:putative tryptophan/tyrosine transport system substrate-binding protein